MASSSAVTIPTPGKSILKRPPPVQQSIFSRITRFLPTQNNNSTSFFADETNGPNPNRNILEEGKPLKRAHFILPQIATVYPISTTNPPSTPTLKEERKVIEEKEIERRKKVVRGNSHGETDEWWNMEKVESFYRECCGGSHDAPDSHISLALKNASGSNPRTVNLSGVQLDFSSSSLLSHVFSIEWGLRKLILRECNLDEHVLKPILHALLIHGTLSFLSVASNRRLKAPAYKVIGAFVAKSRNLQFLDLSQNPLDKKSLEYIVAALPTAPEPGLVSLRLDDCSIRPAALEILCRAVRTSSLRNVSLRHNKITATGAVSLALMIRDYPDVVPATPTSVPASLPSSPTAGTAKSAAPLPSNVSLNSNVKQGGSNRQPTPSSGMQTTYTPYVPRTRRTLGGVSASATAAAAAQLSGVPLISTSSQGGVTTRHPDGANGTAGAGKRDQGPSAALLDKVRALDALPRLGALRTLDLRGNDLRTGVTYVAQVLKRNRTLKVLNLNENKLDVQCLVVIAEALKYNSSLETLDLSRNPCSGPGLEGIQSLRTAFTLNTALKRLFLASTSLTSPGAIALAEFLPESASLLHLDLTENTLDLAGVMALSSGLKANHVMRCLDVNIPPGDDEFARMCRDILNSCVRNTEEAERAANAQIQHGAGASESGRGLGKGVWNMIEESELAKTIRQDEEKKLSQSDVTVRANACIARLKDTLLTPKSSSTLLPPSSLVSPILRTPPTLVVEINPEDSGRAVLTELQSAIENATESERLEELLGINDELISLLAQFPSYGRPSLKLSGLGLDLSGTGMSEEVVRDEVTLSSPPANNKVLDEEEPEPTTPKIDKGKGKAEPILSEVDKVLSPTTLLAHDSSSEDETDDEQPEFPKDDLGVPSPTNRSRSWVEEEGEVFRKGTVLLGPEEMEGEYAGEELRRELLEAMVERPPPRPVLDEYGLEIGVPLDQDAPVPSPSSSIQGTPVVSPSETKPSPRPYIPRTRQSPSTSPSVGSLVPNFIHNQAVGPDILQSGTHTLSMRGNSSPGSSPLSPLSVKAFSSGKLTSPSTDTS